MSELSTGVKNTLCDVAPRCPFGPSARQVTTMSFNQSWGPFGLIMRALGALLFVFIAGTFISLALRAYFRSVERLLEELRNISVENCRLRLRMRIDALGAVVRFSL